MARELKISIKERGLVISPVNEEGREWLTAFARLTLAEPTSKCGLCRKQIADAHFNEAAKNNSCKCENPDPLITIGQWVF